MAIDPTSMDALLAKLNAAREAVSRMPAFAPASTASAPSFADALKSSLERVDSAQTQADALAQHFQLGDPKVTLEDTMVAMAKANISFQQMVQVRNRVVQAYHDIMNMQV